LSLGPNDFKTRNERSSFLSVEAAPVGVCGALKLHPRFFHVPDPEQEQSKVESNHCRARMGLGKRPQAGKSLGRRSFVEAAHRIRNLGVETPG
jgi:hypothetical protein